MSVATFVGDDTRQFCTFYVDDLFLGIDVLKVQEVIRHQAMTKVPLAPGVVSGLINLRGQIVTVVDLRARLGFPPRDPAGEDPDNAPLNVVVRTPDGPVSLLVDEIGDVLYVNSETLEPSPPTLSTSASELINGIYKLDGRLLLVIDTTAAMDIGA